MPRITIPESVSEAVPQGYGVTVKIDGDTVTLVAELKPIEDCALSGTEKSYHRAYTAGFFYVNGLGINLDITSPVRPKHGR